MGGTQRRIAGALPRRPSLPLTHIPGPFPSLSWAAERIYASLQGQGALPNIFLGDGDADGGADAQAAAGEEATLPVRLVPLRRHRASLTGAARPLPQDLFPGVRVWLAREERGSPVGPRWRLVELSHPARDLALRTDAPFRPGAEEERPAAEGSHDLVTTWAGTAFVPILQTLHALDRRFGVHAEFRDAAVHALASALDTCAPASLRDTASQPAVDMLWRLLADGARVRAAAFLARCLTRTPPGLQTTR